jgi:tetratricopeptide (TPR) repeat protein
MRGSIHGESKDHTAAIRDFEVVIRLCPKNPDGYLGRAMAKLELGDHAQADADYSEAIRLDPKAPFQVWFNRGVARSLRGDHGKAVADFSEALRLNPVNIEALLARAYSRQSLDEREYEAGIADQTEAIRLEPENGEARYARGVAYRDKRQFEKAIDDFDAAVQLNGRHEDALVNAAWLRATCPDAKCRDGVKAVKLATRACELTKWEQPKCLAILAAACAEAGNFTSAVQWQEKALADAEYSRDRGDVARQRLKLYKDGKPYHED